MRALRHARDSYDDARVMQKIEHARARSIFADTFAMLPPDISPFH